MRFLLPLALALALALAACSSDPTDGNPPPPQDAQPADIGQDATDVGADRVAVDVTDDRPGPTDVGTVDAGADAGPTDVPRVDATDDRPAPTEAGADAGCTELVCDGRCVDNGPLNCGACGNVCTTSLANTRPGCVERGGAQVCSWGCVTGWLDCNGQEADGCEYDARGGGACR